MLIAVGRKSDIIGVNVLIKVSFKLVVSMTSFKVIPISLIRWSSKSTKS